MLSAPSGIVLIISDVHAHACPKQAWSICSWGVEIEGLLTAHSCVSKEKAMLCNHETHFSCQVWGQAAFSRHLSEARWLSCSQEKWTAVLPSLLCLAYLISILFSSSMMIWEETCPKWQHHKMEQTGVPVSLSVRKLPNSQGAVMPWKVNLHRVHPSRRHCFPRVAQSILSDWPLSSPTLG